jgi:hypothetical protein
VVGRYLRRKLNKNEVLSSRSLRFSGRIQMINKYKVFPNSDACDKENKTKAGDNGVRGRLSAIVWMVRKAFLRRFRALET